MSEGLRITAIVAAYNEEDIIANVVRGLIDEGVSVYLIDNMSSDGTVAAVERFIGRGVIGIETFPDPASGAAASRAGFHWTEILERKEVLAGSLGGDWFIHHDADEFRESPWTGSTLREGISRVDAAGYNAIDFAVFNFPPTGQTFGPGDDARDVFRFYEAGKLWDLTQIKCWKNTGRPVDLVSSGGHDVRFEGRRVFPIRFILRHYPIRSQAHGVRKVFVDRQPRFTTEERERGWHVQYDTVEKDHSFVRDPSTLRLYDPDAVRFELQIHHRHVEALSAQVETLSARIAAQFDELGRREAALAERRVELEAERALAAQFRIDVQAERALSRQRAGELEAEKRASARLGRALEAERSQLEKVQVELAGATARVQDLTRRLEAVYASGSWKVTKPLRALLRLVTPRQTR